MGANHGPHRGAQAVVHVHQFQGWPQVGPKNPTENWYPTHRNVTKFDRCVYVHLLHFIKKKKLGNLHNLGVSKFLSSANFTQIHLQS